MFNKQLKDSVVILCSRPQSKRLPGKVFKKIAGVPAIEHILKRLNETPLHTVIAVPLSDVESYQYLSEKYGVSIMTGDAQSPLHRMANTVNVLIKSGFSDLKWVVRVTHDDVLIDPRTVMELLDACKSAPDCGYGITPKIVDGAGVEIIHVENLLAAAEKRKAPTEFISYFVKNNVRKNQLALRPRPSIERDYRLTMDYPEDYFVINTIMKKVGAFAPLDEVVRFLDLHPSLLNVNRLPDVTVYTCAKNAEEFISDSIKSVLHHDYGVNLEYILIDDASTDRTPLIMAEAASDRRVRFHQNEENIGLASSSNLAISMARGRYVMRLDADDYLCPWALSSLLNKIKEEESAVIYPAYYEITENMQISKFSINPEINHHAGCALMDRRVLNEIRFRDGIRHWDSAELHLQFGLNNVPISYEKRPLWFYRRHKNSLSADTGEERKKTLEEILKGRG